VLPQGQFDEFLRGDPAERREILEALLNLGSLATSSTSSTEPYFFLNVIVLKGEALRKLLARLEQRKVRRLEEGILHAREVGHVDLGDLSEVNDERHD